MDFGVLTSKRYKANIITRLKRTLVSVPEHKVGWHVGNTIPFGSGQQGIFQAVPPFSVTFITGEGYGPDQINWTLEQNPGCHFFFRPYFSPSQDIQAYINYENQVWDMLSQPCWDMIPNGQKHLQIYNEQNMPRHSQWEGFGTQPEDMQRFNERFCIAFDRYTPAFPDWLMGWTPLTIGNMDVCFPDVDPLNVPYYMHGPEAAKVGPTPEEIQAAILSGPCYESLMRAHEYYAHIYVMNDPAVGIFHPAYGMRWQAYQRFFPKQMNIWITENGIGLPGSNYGIWYDELWLHPEIKGTSIWRTGIEISDASHEVVQYLSWYIQQPHPEPPLPTGDFEELLRNHAWNYEGKFQPNIPYNPDAAFQLYARNHGLGIPMSDESDVVINGLTIRFQCFSGAIVYTEVPHWNETTHLAW